VIIEEVIASLIAIFESAGLKIQFVTKHRYWLFGQNSTSLNALLLTSTVYVTAQCSLSTYSCSFVIDIWKLKFPHHKACTSLPIMRIVAIELANFEPVCSHIRILTDLC